MGKTGLIGLILLIAVSPVNAQFFGLEKLKSVSTAPVPTGIRGKIANYTNNHGRDNRINSRSLWQKRDVYVYLPPGYTPRKKYPVLLWLHGLGQDETSFTKYVVPLLDRAISSGKLPPLIAVAPDGSFSGKADGKHYGTFFLNSSAGGYKDYVLLDVMDFVSKRFSIRREKQAHVIAGVDMGGFAAYNYAIQHRQVFGTVIGIFPMLNLRWADKNGNYMADFSPYSWSWLDDQEDSNDLISGGSFFGPTKRVRDWVIPLFGADMDAIPRVALENPIEMLDRMRVRPGELEMYVAYTAKDPYNIDAQVESFLYLAKYRGLKVGVGYDQFGGHNMETAQRFLPGVFQWLAPRIAPYSPVAKNDNAKPKKS